MPEANNKTPYLVSGEIVHMVISDISKNLSNVKEGMLGVKYSKFEAAI